MQHPPIPSPELPPAVAPRTHNRVTRAIAALTISGAIMGVASACVDAPEKAKAETSEIATTYNPVSLREYEPPADCVDPPSDAKSWDKITHTTKFWEIGDGITAVPQRLPGNRIMYFTGDSIAFRPKDTPKDYRSFVRNAMVITCGDDAKSVNPGMEAIPSHSFEEWYWPAASAIIKDKIVVYADKVTTDKEAKDSNMNFKLLGTDIAIFSMPTTPDEIPVFESILHMPDTGKSKVDWGKSVVTIEDYAYVYGTYKSNQPYDFGRDVYVSRIKIADFEKQEYTYWTGKKWSTSAEKAKKIINSPEMPGLDHAWTTFTPKNSKDNKVVFIAQKDGTFGTEIGAWSSKRPYGPFTYKRLGDAPHKKEADDVTYLANAFPAATNKGDDRVLVLTSRNVNGPISSLKGEKAIEYITDHRERYLPEADIFDLAK